MKYRWFLAVITSCLISCVICWPAIFQGKVIFFGDNFHLIIPQKIFFIDQIKQGVFPFWNPYILGGSPYFADINLSIFYPTTILFLTLSLEKALLAIIFIHLVITGVGQYFFSKVMKGGVFASIVAMTVWMLSQPLLMTINHVNITLLQTVTWLPWILGLFVLIVREKHRKAAVLFPMILALAILGGHPQPLLYLLFPGLIYLLLRKNNIKTALLLLIPGMVAAFLMTGFVTLPFLELMSLSTRTGMSPTEALNDSVKLSHYIDLLIPNFFSDPSVGLRWGIYWIDYRKAGIYVTWIGLFLYTWFLSKRSKTRDDIWLGIISIGTLIVALGANLPGLKFVSENISFFQLIRNYSLILIIWPLTASIIIGKAYDLLKVSDKNLQRLWGLLIVIIVVIFTLLFVVNNFFSPLWNIIIRLVPQLSNSTFHTFLRDQIIASHTLTNILLSSLCCLLIITILKTKYRHKRILLIIALIIDLYFSANAILVFGNANVYRYQNNPINVEINLSSTQNYRIVSSAGYIPYTGIPDYWAQYIINPPFVDLGYDTDERQSNRQLITRRNIFGSNWNIPYQLMTPFGTSTFILKSTANYWKIPSSQSFNVNEVDNPKPNDYRLSDQGVKYFVTDKAALNNKYISNGFNIFPIIQEGDYWVILENPDALPIIRFASGSGTIVPLSGTVNQINFQTEAETAGFVLIKVAYYPGWKCSVDGKPCVIEVNDFTMKVSVDEGTHRFHLTFIPTGWPRLFYVSIFSWFTYMIILVITIRRKLLL